MHMCRRYLKGSFSHKSVYAQRKVNKVYMKAADSFLVIVMLGICIICIASVSIETLSELITT